MEIDRTHMNNIIIILVVLLVISSWHLLSRNNDRVDKNTMEEDARESQSVPDNWSVQKDTNSNIGALLFYDKKKNQHIFSIYLNEEESRYGYSFNRGGGDGEIEDAIAIFDFEQKGKALLSMNSQKIKRIELGNGQDRKRISINPEKPFAIVIPDKSGKVTLYDINNEIITNHSL